MMVSPEMVEAAARADASYAGRTFDALASSDKVRFTERAKFMLEAALAASSEIDRLKRENATLKIDASNHAADAEAVRREREVERRRAEAAETKVKQLREALQNMMGIYDTPLSRRRMQPDAFMTEALNTARTALASTGGKHNAE